MLLSLCFLLQNMSNCKPLSFSALSDLKLQLKKAGDDYALTEIRVKESITSLTKEKDKFLNLSMERGKVIQVNKKSVLFPLIEMIIQYAMNLFTILFNLHGLLQEKQEEIHLLEVKWNEEKKVRIKAEER